MIWRKCFLKHVLLGTFPYGQRILDFTPRNHQEMSLLFEIQRIDGMVAMVNERVRGSGFSSKEILFSRDQVSHENLALEDDKIAEEKKNKREIGNEYSAKSKATVLKPSCKANAKQGQLVFLKREGDKLSRRELYLVLKVETDDTLDICKLLHTISGNVATLQPHNTTYKVKQSDVYLAPNQPLEIHPEIAENHPPPPIHLFDRNLPSEVQQAHRQAGRKKTNLSHEEEDFDDDDDDWYEDITDVDEQNAGEDHVEAAISVQESDEEDVLPVRDEESDADDIIEEEIVEEGPSENNDSEEEINEEEPSEADDSEEENSEEENSEESTSENAIDADNEEHGSSNTR